MKFKTVLLLTLALLLCALPACAVEFTDAYGHTVTVENPRRVVSLYNSYGDAWLLSGGELVGTIADEDTPEGVANLGSHLHPNMELLFALEPDFVLLSATASTHAEIGDVLRSAGIPCAGFDTPDWRSYMENIRLFTAITGREEMYRRQLETVQAPIEATIAEAQAMTGHFGQTTALLLRADSSKVKAKGSDATVAGNILRDMGFVNLADGESPLAEKISMEHIIIEDPDWIFVYLAGSDSDAARATLQDTLLGNPAWSTLTAVQEGRFIILDRDLFHYHPNDRWAESFAVIAGLLKGENP